MLNKDIKYSWNGDSADRNTYTMVPVAFIAPAEILQHTICPKDFDTPIPTQLAQLPNRPVSKTFLRPNSLLSASRAHIKAVIACAAAKELNNHPI